MIPCLVRHITDTLVIEQDHELRGGQLPLPGARMFRIDAVKGVVLQTNGESITIEWDVIGIRTYNRVDWDAIC